MYGLRGDCLELDLAEQLALFSERVGECSLIEIDAKSQKVNNIVNKVSLSNDSSWMRNKVAGEEVDM